MVKKNTLHTFAPPLFFSGEPRACGLVKIHSGLVGRAFDFPLLSRDPNVFASPGFLKEDVEERERVAVEGLSNVAAGLSLSLLPWRALSFALAFLISVARSGLLDVPGDLYNDLRFVCLESLSSPPDSLTKSCAEEPFEPPVKGFADDGPAIGDGVGGMMVGVDGCCVGRRGVVFGIFVSLGDMAGESSILRFIGLSIPIALTSGPSFSLTVPSPRSACSKSRSVLEALRCKSLWPWSSDVTGCSPGAYEWLAVDLGSGACWRNMDARMGKKSKDKRSNILTSTMAKGVLQTEWYHGLGISFPREVKHTT